MNNKGNNKGRPLPSIDGFIRGGSPQSKPSGNGLQNFNRYHRPRNTGSSSNELKSLDGFNRSVDGFAYSNPDVVTTSRQRENTGDIMKTFAAKKAGPEFSASKSKSSRPRYEKSSKSDKSDKKPKKSLFSRLGKKGKKPGRRTPSMRLKIAAAFGSLLLLIGGGLAIRAYLISRNIFKGGGSSALLHNQDIDPSQLKGEGDGRINILILGKGGPEQRDGPDLTDTIIIASIDPIADEAALLSIPRDFWVKQPSGYQSKINQVYYDGKQSKLNSYSYNERNSNEAKDAAEKAGIDSIKQVVSETMGVPIHYYGMIDFAGFRKAIDTVGGIDINVSKDQAVYETMRLNTGRYVLNVKEGWNHFDGTRALAFARSRKTSARGDFARSERQRAVIVALKDKVLSTGTLVNPVRMNQLMSDFAGQLYTDFSVNEMLRLYDIGKEIQGDKVVSVGLDEYVGGDMLNGLSVQVPKAGIFDYTEIQNYVRNIMRDSFLKKEDARIVILNGTETPGLATKKSTELKSFGYNIVSVGDAPTATYTNTILVDLRSGANKYTLNYLEKRLNLKAVTSLPDSTIDATEADFVIILGSNNN